MITQTPADNAGSLGKKSDAPSVGGGAVGERIGSPAEQAYASIFASVRSFFDLPEVKAIYAAEAKRNAAIWEREQREAQAKRDAEAAEKSRARSYDIWALNGGSDECTQFGINDGCKPYCPVFERGQCEMQAENEQIFAMTPKPQS